MQIQINDFFKPLRLKKLHDEREYQIANRYLQAVEAFSMSAHQFVYVIDYHKKGFLYVSDNPLFLCGEKPQDVQSMGYGFYEKYVPRKDLEMLLIINEKGFDFYYKLNVYDRLNYSISYDFHLIQPNKNKVLVNHRLTPMTLDQDSNIWLALCVVSLSTANKAGNIIITGKGRRKSYEYNLKTLEWEVKPELKLTPKEREILTTSTQGLSGCEIAGKLGISEATVKFHKKNIFKKMKVTNIAAAITHASNYNLIIILLFQMTFPDLSPCYPEL